MILIMRSSLCSPWNLFHDFQNHQDLFHPAQKPRVTVTLYREFTPLWAIRDKASIRGNLEIKFHDLAASTATGAHCTRRGKGELLLCTLSS